MKANNKFFREAVLNRHETIVVVKKTKNFPLLALFLILSGGVMVAIAKMSLVWPFS